MNRVRVGERTGRVGGWEREEEAKSIERRSFNALIGATLRRSPTGKPIRSSRGFLGSSGAYLSYETVDAPRACHPLCRIGNRI